MFPSVLLPRMKATVSAPVTVTRVQDQHLRLQPSSSNALYYQPWPSPKRICPTPMAILSQFPTPRCWTSEPKPTPNPKPNPTPQLLVRLSPLQRLTCSGSNALSLFSVSLSKTKISSNPGPKPDPNPNSKPTHNPNTNSAGRCWSVLRFIL